MAGQQMAEWMAGLSMFCGFSSELKPGSRTKPTKSMEKLDIF